MSLKERIQQHEADGHRPQSVEATAQRGPGGQYWVTRYAGQRIEAASLEDLTSAIMELSGEPVEVR